MRFFKSISKSFNMVIKQFFNQYESFIDYILKKTIKQKRKYSSEFLKIILEDLKLPKEVYENEQITKLVCKVIADSSFNYSTEFRCILLKKLILPKEVFLYKKFTKLICKVAVTRMSPSFIKMKCKRAVLKKKVSKEKNIIPKIMAVIPKKKRGRPPKSKLINFSKNKNTSNELRILTATEINESYLKQMYNANFFKCKVRLNNCYLRSSIKNEFMTGTDSSSSMYVNGTSTFGEASTIECKEEKFKMEDI